MEATLTKPIVSEDAEQYQKKIFAIASGKGGTGKSTVAINFSLALAALGHSVVLVDADLGGADLNVLLNILQPQHSLKDYLDRTIDSLDEILQFTPTSNFKVLLNGSDIVSLSNPNWNDKVRMIKGIQSLNADYIIVDLGPDIAYNNLDFFNMAPTGYLITQNVDTMVMGFYRFLKAAFTRRVRFHYRRFREVEDLIDDYKDQGWQKGRFNIVSHIRSLGLEYSNMLDSLLEEYNPALIFNKVNGKAAHSTAERICEFVRRNYGFKLRLGGFIPEDKRVINAYEMNVPFIFKYPHCDASAAIFEVLRLSQLNKTPSGQVIPKFGAFVPFLKREADKWGL
jgi:flagellar biosynthesis protein FlhG